MRVLVAAAGVVGEKGVNRNETIITVVTIFAVFAMIAAALVLQDRRESRMVAACERSGGIAYDRDGIYCDRSERRNGR